MKFAKRINKIRARRARRARAIARGTAERPRLSVFRSNRFTYVQLINDENGKTVASVSTQELSKKGKITKGDAARKLGEMIAKKAIEHKIKEVVFDRGQYRYHGRVKGVAEGAREGGLKF